MVYQLSCQIKNDYVGHGQNNGRKNTIINPNKIILLNILNK